MTTNSPPPVPRWWMSIDGNPAGPFDESYILACLNGGQVPASALICLEGSQQWQPLSSWPGFARAMQAASSHSQPANAYPQPAATSTSLPLTFTQVAPSPSTDDPRFQYQRRKQSRQFWWWLIGTLVPILLALRVLVRLFQ